MALKAQLGDVLSTNDPRSPQDTCFLAIHLVMCDKGFKPTKVNEIDSVEIGAHPRVLPAGWNMRDAYVIFYQRGSVEYVLKALKMDADLFCQFMAYGTTAPESTADLATWMCSTADYIQDSALFYKAYHVTQQKVLEDRVLKELIDPTLPAVKLAGAAVFNPEDPFREASDTRTTRDSYRRPGGTWHTEPAPPAAGVGSADLTPGGFGQGGMIYDPLRVGGVGSGRRGGGIGGGAGSFVLGGVPSGSVPPGARFDPFGPPMAGPRFPGGGQLPGSGPDWDGAPLPGFEGDMNPRNPFGGRGGPRGPGFGGGFGGPGFGGGFGDPGF